VIVGVHQPEFIPWLGFWNQLLHADLFVLTDTTYFRKRHFQNRNRIRTESDWTWLVIPVNQVAQQRVAEARLRPFHEIEMAWMLLAGTYGETAYWKEYAPEIREALKTSATVFDLNYTLILLIRDWLGIKTRIAHSSQVLSLDTDDFLTLSLNVARAAGGRVILSSSAFKQRLLPDHARQHNLQAVFQRFRCHSYPQIYPGFQERMSVLDCLFTHGAAYTMDVIKHGWSLD